MDEDWTDETSNIAPTPPSIATHDKVNNIIIEDLLANEALECTEDDIAAIGFYQGFTMYTESDEELINRKLDKLCCEGSFRPVPLISTNGASIDGEN